MKIIFIDTIIMKIQLKLPFCISDAELKSIALFSCFYNVDFLINLIFALLSLNIITRLVIGINNTIIKNNVKTTAYNHLTRILASLVYLIPLSQFKSMHNDELKKMNFLRYNFIRLLPNRIKSNIIRDTYFHNIALGFILKNETIIILILSYFFIVKEKKFKLNYFFRFHFIHAILILFLQIFLMFLRKYLLAFVLYVPSNQFKNFIITFANTMLVFNLCIILYSIFYAANNLYTNIPFITPGCESHIGKENSNVK